MYLRGAVLAETGGGECPRRGGAPSMAETDVAFPAPARTFDGGAAPVWLWCTRGRPRVFTDGKLEEDEGEMR